MGRRQATLDPPNPCKHCARHPRSVSCREIPRIFENLKRRHLAEFVQVEAGLGRIVFRTAGPFGPHFGVSRLPVT